MRVNLSSDFRHLYIAVEGALDWEYLAINDSEGNLSSSFLSPLPVGKTSSLGSPSAPSYALGVIDINTSLLWSRRNELKMIAAQSASISSHLSHIGTTLQLMSEKWSQSINEFNLRCHDFANMLQGKGLFLYCNGCLTNNTLSRKRRFRDSASGVALFPCCWCA